MPIYRHKQNHNPNRNAKPLRPDQIERMLHGKVLKNPPLPKIEEAQHKGEAMPDIQTALSNALENGKRAALTQTMQEWEQDEKQTQLEKPVTTGKQNLFEVTNNVTRATFNYVLNNPNCTMKQIKSALGTFNTTSVGSLLTQFVHQKQIERSDDGRYKALIPAYKPLMTRAKWEKLNGIVRQKSKKLVVKRRTVEDVEAARAASGIETLAVAEAKSVGRFKQYKPWTPDEIVNTLNVMQARQLYDYLKNVFGG